MDTSLSIVFLAFFICLIGNTNGIQCYNCLFGCSDPFDRTNPNVQLIESSNGWCMKFKTMHKSESMVFRSADPLGFCTENTCRSTERNGYQGIGCCCNTELCNDSNTISKSLSSFIALTFLVGLNFILNCPF